MPRCTARDGDDVMTGRNQREESECLKSDLVGVEGVRDDF